MKQRHESLRGRIPPKEALGITDDTEYEAIKQRMAEMVARQEREHGKLPPAGQRPRHVPAPSAGAAIPKRGTVWIAKPSRARVAPVVVHVAERALRPRRREGHRTAALRGPPREPDDDLPHDLARRVPVGGVA
jgi:hypothetical protein